MKVSWSSSRLRAARWSPMLSTVVRSCRRSPSRFSISAKRNSCSARSICAKTRRVMLGEQGDPPAIGGMPLGRQIGDPGEDLLDIDGTAGSQGRGGSLEGALPGEQVIVGEGFQACPVLPDAPGMEDKENRNEYHPDGWGRTFQDQSGQTFGKACFLVKDELFSFFTSGGVDHLCSLSSPGRSPVGGSVVVWKGAS
jgi:hypothetical protein